MDNDLLLNTLRGLIEEGERVLSTHFDAGDRDTIYLGGRPRAVDLRSFAKWGAGCVNLIRLLGDLGEPWRTALVEKTNYLENVEEMLGTLLGIEEAVQRGLLVKIEDLVRAEAFDNLLEQAEYLSSEGYSLAAGVLGRAVLEEHLRSWCHRAKCVPTKDRPTLNDFTSELYRAKVINIIVMKQVEAMAAIGNDAAHNNPVTPEDVARLLRDVREFLAKHA